MSSFLAEQWYVDLEIQRSIDPDADPQELHVELLSEIAEDQGKNEKPTLTQVKRALPYAESTVLVYADWESKHGLIHDAEQPEGEVETSRNTEEETQNATDLEDLAISDSERRSGLSGFAVAQRDLWCGDFISWEDFSTSSFCRVAVAGLGFSSSGDASCTYEFPNVIFSKARRPRKPRSLADMNVSGGVQVSTSGIVSVDVSSCCKNQEDSFRMIATRDISKGEAIRFFPSTRLPRSGSAVKDESVVLDGTSSNDTPSNLVFVPELLLLEPDIRKRRDYFLRCYRNGAFDPSIGTSMPISTGEQEQGDAWTLEGQQTAAHASSQQEKAIKSQLGAKSSEIHDSLRFQDVRDNYVALYSASGGSGTIGSVNGLGLRAKYERLIEILETLSASANAGGQGLRVVHSMPFLLRSIASDLYKFGLLLEEPASKVQYFARLRYEACRLVYGESDEKTQQIKSFITRPHDADAMMREQLMLDSDNCMTLDRTRETLQDGHGRR
ncbi:unnamed protein product [Amoebophrya sp. A25]|nr:unnamed protein product [Amoebophrya sp. A25]|eukprot:GSA25T00015338001.1